jgi:hypothetical protein
MSSNTPPLNHQAKKDYLEVHLFNELRWLLGAATEWFIQEQLKLGIVGYDVQVYAMDSAFVHARSLFEFFVGKSSKNHYSVKHFIAGAAPLTSASYTKDWSVPLHKYVIHAQTRLHPAPLSSSGTQKDLNKMPVDFAIEILRLWKEFEDKLGSSSDANDQELHVIAHDRRLKAIENAKCAVHSCVTEHFAKQKGVVLKPVF